MNVLKVQNLTKKYDEKSGIFNLNINIECNDIVLLLGPNGSGKTTAFKGILGLTAVEYETIDILSFDIGTKKVEALKKVGAMVSKPAFYEYLTGYEHLKMLESVYDNVDAFKVDQILKKIGLLNRKVNWSGRIHQE